MMDQSSFGAFQHQITQNQAELTDYLKDLDSWKASISEKDKKLQQKNSSAAAGDNKVNDTDKNYPPIRNSLHKKKKKTKKKESGKPSVNKKQPSTRIPGSDFRAWDKFDVDKALEDIDGARSESSSEEETDEEWEEERMKQQAIFEKDQGNDYYKKNKLDEAINCYTKGLACDPTNAILYANRAMALLKQDKFGAVEQDCTDAIALDPLYVKAYMRRATARQKLKKHQSALSDYTKVLSLEPENKAAKREVAVLQQELAICEEGLVIPIKKEMSKRSKKPLVRIEIEDIDHENVKQKLNEAVAKTTQSQSSEKKRIVAKDEEMFSKYTNNEDTTPPTKVQCPADIRLPNLGSDKQTDNVIDSPRVKSPHTSPRAPANSYQFQKDWKTVKGDVDRCYEYLKLIPATDFPKLIGEFLDANMLKTILIVLHTRFIRDGVDVYKHMLSLSRVKRFSMVVMFMSGGDKQDARNIVKHLSTQEGVTSAQADQLHKLYEL